MVSLGEVVQATEYHFQRNAVKGQHEFFINSVAKVDRKAKNNQVAQICRSITVQILPASAPTADVYYDNGLIIFYRRGDSSIDFLDCLHNRIRHGLVVKLLIDVAGGKLALVT